IIRSAISPRVATDILEISVIYTLNNMCLYHSGPLFPFITGIHIPNIQFVLNKFHFESFAHPSSIADELISLVAHQSKINASYIIKQRLLIEAGNKIQWIIIVYVIPIIVAHKVLNIVNTADPYRFIKGSRIF